MDSPTEGSSRRKSDKEMQISLTRDPGYKMFVGSEEVCLLEVM